MTKLERKEIQTCSSVYMSSTLKCIKEDIDDWIEEYGEDAELVVDAYYNDITFEVIYMRPETDQEYAIRLKDHERMLAEKEKSKQKRYKESI